MKLNRITYRFKKLDQGPRPFKGMSIEEFRLICRYLDDLTPAGFRKAGGFVVVASFSTRLGVIDCFVN